MSLKIALVTNTALHHKYWITEMMQHHDVRCILHPHPAATKGKWASMQGVVRERGRAYAGLLLLTKLYAKFSPNILKKEFQRASKKYFASATERYDAVPTDLIHHVTTVNSEEAISIIREHEIDVICFLGGDIARAAFINSARVTCLNFHSGISPIYNGAKSFAWAVAENRPNLAGGTLMEMSEKIDGGDIVSHFLPGIETGDTASSLFMKTVAGAVGLYHSAIDQLEDGGTLTTVKQERSIRYTKAIDWTLYQEIQLQAFYRSGKMKRYLREARVVVPARDGQQRLYIPEVLESTLQYHRRES